MGKALYRTHRSKKLSEVVGQDHITKTLQNALKSGKISHAYLFTGPRGVGKTSVARILAHEINELPYQDDERQHIDIIEIDAASNRRIDEIRDLRDKARLSPLEAAYKVYIIDEVHMLTREAFNALLKTLEEPPEHVIFILATTEAHKLPETIVSRTQRYSFRPIETADAVKHLKSIAKTEKIVVDEPALELIAAHGNGSFRDSISLLDQMSNTGMDISVETVRQHLGIPPDEVVTDLVDAVKTHDAKAILVKLHEAESRGYQAAILASALSERFRAALLDASVPKDEALAILRGLIAVNGAEIPYQELELVLLEASLSNQPANEPQQTVRQVIPKPTPPKPVTESPKTKPAEKKAGAPNKPTIKKNPNLQLQTELDDGLWDKILEQLRGTHNTLYGMARMATVKADDEVLVLGFAFDFHKRRFNESRNQEKLQEIITTIVGGPVEVRCEIDKQGPKETPERDEPAEKSAPSDTLESITKVFGGGEVLED